MDLKNKSIKSYQNHKINFKVIFFIDNGGMPLSCNSSPSKLSPPLVQTRFISSLRRNYQTNKVYSLRILPTLLLKKKDFFFCCWL